jgi:hypothetical protein
MVKVVALSKYGFKVDSLRNNWEKVDKSLLKKEVFNMLEKGIEIEIKERNTKGFILDFKILNHKARKLEEEHTDSPLINIDNQNSLSSSSSEVKNGLMYGQCVNLAFNHVSSTELGLNIDEAFDLADKIYKEYLKRV